MSDDKPTDIENPMPAAPDVLRAVRRLGNVDPVTERGEQASFNKRFFGLSERSARAKAHLDGLQAHYEHKGRWSRFLIYLMGWMVLYQSIVISCVGFGWWSFSEYTWLLPALLVQNFAQIVGLAIFVVKSLFKDIGGGFGSDEALEENKTEPQ